MRYLLMMRFEDLPGVPPVHEWSQADLAAHVAYQQTLGQELARAGELVDGQGLLGPETARFVTSDGANPPVVSEPPYPHHHELLAGFWVVEVPSEERALEIAGRLSAAPGPGGRALQQPIEVRGIAAPQGERRFLHEQHHSIG